MTDPLPTLPSVGHSRIALVRTPGQILLEGAWWPRTDRLDDELPPLDRAVRAALGAGIARFSYTLGSWVDQPRKVRTERHLIQVGWFTHGATRDSVDLSLDDYRRVVLTVIPAGTPDLEAETVLSSFALADVRPGTDLGRRGATRARPTHHGLPAHYSRTLEALDGQVRRALAETRSMTDPAARARAAVALEAELTLAGTQARALRTPAPADLTQDPDSVASTRAPWA